MEVQNGFIIGIFNWCDRWCERCEFTSRCRVFADGAELEASFDPGLRALVNAPPLPEEAPPPVPRAIREMIDEMNRVSAEPLSAEESARLEPTLPKDHDRILDRAHRYCMRVHAWLEASDVGRESASDPRAVVAWFHTLIPAKIHRSLTGLAEDVPADRDWPGDHEGSAKVAILGIDESHAAWLQIEARGLADAAVVQPMIGDLVWLGEQLERLFPKARAFVRPAFDEPDAVARMLAAEGRP